MDPLPATVAMLARDLTWPDPNEDGTTTLSATTLRQTRTLLSALVTYIEEQLALCARE
jgi:hypothetical protein